ncbi:MAG: DUF262 domain-containing HNH endonuclease family protein [Fimbriimonadaceae bacterium]|nr:DUF262 domain-containing HNH endonuclease family protein [Fimbriimonadaceae bacterium]
MSKSTLLATKTVNLRTLFSNGTHYEVPAYQRDYSWSEEHWEDLWDDIVASEKSGRPHYMGAIVLTEQAVDQYRIIDGQQRLATLSILVVAALRSLQDWIANGVQPEANAQRRELLRNAFLGGLHPVTLRTAPKLTLNESNRRFYEGILLNLQNPPSVSALPPAEKLLWNALEFFRAKLREKFFADQDGEALATFIYEVVSTLLVFIQVTVEDEAGAYTVFETLNARGLELTAGDLLKNYLLSTVHVAGEGSLRQAGESWQAIANRVQARRLPEFLRHCLNSRLPFVRQGRVYKSIRTDVKDASQVFALLEELDQASVLVEALDDPTHGFWDELPGANKAVRSLKLYGVVQYRPLAIAVFRNQKLHDLERVLRAIDVISFRYSMIAQRNTNKLEDVYNRLAIKVTNQELLSGLDVENALKGEIYVSDDEFKEAFAKRAISTGGQKTRLVKYVLFALQKQEFNTDRDWETDPATIEHVLPTNPDESWKPYFAGDLHERYVDRLGNYLLLESKLNAKLAGNKPYAEKLEIYAQSQYPGTSRIEFPEWTPQAIESRQQQMARFATAIWKL